MSLEVLYIDQDVSVIKTKPYLKFCPKCENITLIDYEGIYSCNVCGILNEEDLFKYYNKYLEGDE